MAASYRKTPVLESLFNSKYCEIFNSFYFKEHLRRAASENVLKEFFNFRLKKEALSTSIENVCFYFMIGFPQSLFHTQYFFGDVRNKLQTLNI